MSSLPLWQEVRPGEASTTAKFGEGEEEKVKGIHAWLPLFFCEVRGKLTSWEQ